ncbi:MAG: hypothetical protein WC659_05245 [Patescibacteria group bacterium]
MQMSIGLIIVGVLFSFVGFVLFGILRHLILLVLAEAAGELVTKTREAIQTYLKFMGVVVLSEAIGLNYLGLVFIFGTPDKIIFGLISLAVLILLLGGGIKGEKFIPTVTGLAWVEFGLATTYLIAPEELRALFGELRQLPFLGNLALVALGYLVVSKVARKRTGQSASGLTTATVSSTTTPASGYGSGASKSKGSGLFGFLIFLLVLGAAVGGILFFTLPKEKLTPEYRAEVFGAVKGEVGKVTSEVKSRLDTFRGPQAQAAPAPKPAAAAPMKLSVDLSGARVLVYRESDGSAQGQFIGPVLATAMTGTISRDAGGPETISVALCFSRHDSVLAVASHPFKENESYTFKSSGVPYVWAPKGTKGKVNLVLN